MGFSIVVYVVKCLAYLILIQFSLLELKLYTTTWTELKGLNEMSVLCNTYFLCDETFERNFIKLS